MAPFLLDTGPLDLLLNGLILLVVGPLVIWLLVAMSRPQSRGTAMAAATVLAIVAWLGWLLGALDGFFGFLLVLPFIVCLWRLRSAYNKPPRA